MSDESTSEQKPREFWICNKKMEAGGFYYAEEKEKQPDLYPHYTHVIEASYAKELEAKLALAVEALEFLSDKEERNTYMENVRYARAVLAMIEKGEK